MPHPHKKAIFYTSQKLSFYIGRLEHSLKRINVSPTLLISTEDELELYDQSNNLIFRSNSLLIPSGINVTINTHGAKVAQYFLDDIGEDFAKLSPQMNNTINIDGKHRLYSNIHNEADIIKQAKEISTTRPSAEYVLELINNWIGNANPYIAAFSDERVNKVIALIKENYNENISVADLSKHVNISVPRLIQLFKQVTGIPIRRFRLWHRIFVTASKLTEGFSLTEAALAAGFSDYAQFSRTYRELNGASPAAAKNNTEIRISAAL